MMFELMKGITDETFTNIKGYYIDNPFEEEELQPLTSRGDFMKLWRMLQQ
jgi:hypothetical protein